MGARLRMGASCGAHPSAVTAPVPPEQREPEGSFALLGPEERLYAAGERGTLLERRDGRWRAIATRSNADLRWFDGRLAVGPGRPAARL